MRWNTEWKGRLDEPTYVCIFERSNYPCEAIACGHANLGAFTDKRVSDLLMLPSVRQGRVRLKAKTTTLAT